MSEFVQRVSQYKVVDETCKAASGAYQQAKEKETLNKILSKIESAGSCLSSMLRPIFESNVAHKMDDIACRQFLDRFESFCPSVKDASTEQVLGPVANRAVSLAETCADYCLPKDGDAESLNDATRTERLSKLRTRANTQALTVFHSSVHRAQEMLNSLTTYGASLTEKVPTVTITTTLTHVASVLSFAYNTAKVMSFPVIVHGLDSAISQTNRVNEQLRDSGRLNWLDLQTVTSTLETVRTYLVSQLPQATEGEQLELQPLQAEQTSDTSDKHQQKNLTQAGKNMEEID